MHNGGRVCWFVAIKLTTQSLLPGDSLEITCEYNQYLIVVDEAIRPPYYVAVTLCGTLISHGKELSSIIDLVTHAEDIEPPLTCLYCLASVAERGARYRRWNERKRR